MERQYLPCFDGCEYESLQHEIDRLRAKVKALSKCCTQRGARMQIMRDFLVKIDEPHMDMGWRRFVADYNHPEAAGWFDADGVPVGEGE